MSHPQSWVSWFVESSRGSIFIPIDREYLENNYNFYGLRQKVPNFKYSLDLIRGPYVPRDQRPPDWPTDIDDFGMCLYGLLHARYLITPAGQGKMLEKVQAGAYPRCPRMLCRGCFSFPYGTSDDIGQSNVKVFCPNCHDVYSIPEKRFAAMDGAFFGPSWVHIFLARFPQLVPPEMPERYVPRIFGFRITPPHDT
jgi:casein kinase II subunit beta